MNKLLKNILTGVGSVLVIAPPAQASQLNRDNYISKSDASAIHGDWVSVGNDMKSAAGSVNSGQKEG